MHMISSFMHGCTLMHNYYTTNKLNNPYMMAARLISLLLEINCFSHISNTVCVRVK